MTDYAKLLRDACTYKELFPAGTRVVLLGMEDSYAPVPKGTRGTVDFVDDFGQIHMKWDNGRTLAIVPQVDSFRKLNEVELLNENLLRKADFLVDFFWAQHIYMSVEVEDNHLIARDDEGNEWKDAEIYDFGLNDCLCFNEDGSLSKGLAAAEPFVEQLKADAKEFGVEITAISQLNKTNVCVLFQAVGDSETMNRVLENFDSDDLFFDGVIEKISREEENNKISEEFKILWYRYFDRDILTDDLVDQFVRLTHHAECLYEDTNAEYVHVEVEIDGKWYGRNEKEISVNDLISDASSRSEQQDNANTQYNFEKEF